MAAVVDALQAMRGVSLLAAVTLVAEVGDFTRFANPRQLMAYLGLVPSEASSGGRTRRGGITKAGNHHARRVLIEGAWTYRFAARLSRGLHAVRPLPAACRRRQAQGRGHHRRRPRDGRVRLGDRLSGATTTGRLNRPRHPAGKGDRNTTTDNFACGHGRRRAAVGNPPSSYEPICDRRSPLERGSPETKPRSCGPNPRLRVCSTVVSTPASCHGRWRQPSSPPTFLETITLAKTLARKHERLGQPITRAQARHMAEPHWRTIGRARSRNSRPGTRVSPSAGSSSAVSRASRRRDRSRTRSSRATCSGHLIAPSAARPATCSWRACRS